MIVSKFNGDIDFTSEHQSGSNFHFTFETEDFDCDQFIINELIREEEED